MSQMGILLIHTSTFISPVRKGNYCFCEDVPSYLHSHVLLLQHQLNMVLYNNLFYQTLLVLFVMYLEQLNTSMDKAPTETPVGWKFEPTGSLQNGVMSMETHNQKYKQL